MREHDHITSHQTIIFCKQRNNTNTNDDDDVQFWICFALHHKPPLRMSTTFRRSFAMFRNMLQQQPFVAHGKGSKQSFYKVFQYAHWVVTTTIKSCTVDMWSHQKYFPNFFQLFSFLLLTMLNCATWKKRPTIDMPHFEKILRMTSKTWKHQRIRLNTWFILLLEPASHLSREFATTSCTVHVLHSTLRHISERDFLTYFSCVDIMILYFVWLQFLK